MPRDPLLTIMNEYLDANPSGDWRENVGAMRLLIWLKENGHINIKGENYDKQGNHREHLGGKQSQ